MFTKTKMLLVMTLLTMGTTSAWAYVDCGDEHEVNYYEMFVSPDIDGFGKPTAQGDRMINTPARLLGDGFGSKAAGDFDAGAGLLLDGTARFIDSGAHGSNGFLMKQYSSAGGSLYLRIKVNADTVGNNSAYTIGIGGASTYYMCVAIDTTGIRLVNNTGTIASSETIDMTTWRIVRIQQSSQSCRHGLTNGVSYVRVFVDQVGDPELAPDTNTYCPVAGTPVIGWTQMYAYNASALEYAPVQHTGTGWWMILGSNAETTQADFVLDWARMTGERDAWWEGCRSLPLGRTYIRHPYGLIEPAATYTDSCGTGTYSNNVWNTACDWRVYPQYIASAIVEKNATTATPGSITYQVVNTSYNNANTISWTVQEVDSGGSAMDYAWLDLDKSGGTLGATQGTGDEVTATLNSNVSSLPSGWTVGYLKFTNSTCSLTQTRPIYIAVRDPADFLVYEYCGDVPPTQADSAGTGLRFRQWGIQNNGQTYPNNDLSAVEAENTTVEDVVTLDLDAWNGKALKLIEGAEQRSVFLSDDNAGSNNVAGYPVIDRLLGATVVARLKVVSPGLGTYSTTRKVGIQISGSNGSLWPSVYNECIADVWGSITYSASATILQDGFRRGGGFLDAQRTITTTDDNYHVLRLAVIGGINDNAKPGGTVANVEMMSNPYGRKIMMWCDEHLGNTAPVLDVQNKYYAKLVSSYQAYNGFQIGVQEKLAGHEVLYDWVTFTNAGAFGPGEEDAYIGRSLIPTSTRCQPCNDVLGADADKDGDVDQDDFAQFQACYSGDSNYPTEPGNCNCFDADGGGKIDAADFEAFTACATGPGIPVTLATAPDCAALLLNTWEANDGHLGHLCGALLDTNDWSCTTAETVPCFMSYGPNVVMQAGNYVARLYLRVDDISGTDDEVCNIDVYSTQGGLLAGPLNLTRFDFAEAGVYQAFDVPFTNPTDGYWGEFRVQYLGNAQLDLDKVELLRQ